MYLQLEIVSIAESPQNYRNCNIHIYGRYTLLVFPWTRASFLDTRVHANFTLTGSSKIWPNMEVFVPEWRKPPNLARIFKFNILWRRDKVEHGYTTTNLRHMQNDIKHFWTQTAERRYRVHKL